MKRNSEPRNGVYRVASLADDVTRDAAVDELVGHLEHVLRAARHHLHPPAAADEDHDDQERRGEHEDRRSC